MSGAAAQGADRGTAVGADTRFECGVCWWVYDPAAGDPVWQVPPGTPFSRLPSHWTCPNCATTQDRFMVLLDD